MTDDMVLVAGKRYNDIDEDRDYSSDACSQGEHRLSCWGDVVPSELSTICALLRDKRVSLDTIISEFSEMRLAWDAYEEASRDAMETYDEARKAMETWEAYRKAYRETWEASWEAYEDAWNRYADKIIVQIQKHINYTEGLIAIDQSQLYMLTKNDIIRYNLNTHETHIRRHNTCQTWEKIEQEAVN